MEETKLAIELKKRLISEFTLDNSDINSKNNAKKYVNSP